MLAAADGGDEIAAAAVLAWAVMPGACALANRLRTLAQHIDELVAAQLWVEVRTFPWRRLTKVAANLLMNTRTGVLRDQGVRSQVSRMDRAWGRTSLVDPDGPFWAHYAVSQCDDNPTAAEELFAVLEWGCETDVITMADRALLLCLVEAADRDSLKAARGASGLLSRDASAQVASELGIGSKTVRRRARRSVDALAGAFAEGRFHDE
jgi:hypothetical protein